MDGEALEALRYFSDATHPQSFVTLAGRGPVLVSAPHAVLQTRSGRLKAAERYTGMLCLMLNRRHDVPGIYKARHLMDDANHDPSSPYRNEVCRLIREGGIRCVLDLHQLRPDRSMALCIGTGRGRHVRAFEGAPDVVRSAFMRRGLSPVTLDDPFSALDRATETEIFAHLRRLAADSVVILISHRLYLFPELDRVIWLENGEAKVGTHEELVENTPDYAAQFDAQREENSHE